MKMKMILPMMLIAALPLGADAQNKSGLVMSNLDKTVKPADTLYQFATGGWQKNNPLPAAYSRYGSFDQLAENNNKRINTILSELQKKTYKAGTIEQKLSDFYKLSMDVDSRNKAGIAPVKPLMDEIEAAKTKDELQKLQEKKYHLRGLFHEAATITGYMGGAFIFIDTGEEKTELPLRINDTSAELVKGGTLRFVVVDPVNVSPGDYNSSNPLKADYMRPKWYWVLGQRVHASRMIPLYDNPPPTLLRPAYNFLGIPQAQILWDYVMHWNQCRVYTADLVRKVSLLVFQTSTDDIFNSPNGLQLFDIRMKALQRYRDNSSVFVCDKDAEAVMNVQTSIAGCTDVVRQSLEMIAALNRTPAVKLLGISPSGFNATGESDIRNYYDYIKSKQELRRDAIMTCLKAIELVEFGAIDADLSFDFNPLGKEDENAAAMTAQSRAGTLATLAQMQAISAEEVREAVKTEPAMHLGFLSDEPPDGDPEDFQGLLDSLQSATEAIKAPEAPQANPPDESRQLLQSLGGVSD